MEWRKLRPDEKVLPDDVFVVNEDDHVNGSLVIRKTYGAVGHRADVVCCGPTHYVKRPVATPTFAKR